MTQDRHVSEKEEALPFLVIADVLFTCLVVTIELLFSEHSRAHDASDDLWHAQSLLALGRLYVLGVCGVVCVCSLIYSDFKQFSLHCPALCSQCSFG